MHQPPDIGLGRAHGDAGGEDHAADVFAADDHVEVAAVPALKAHVTDLAGLLSGNQRAAWKRGWHSLTSPWHHHGSQIAVLLVPSTQPETIEAYGIRVGDAWKIGRKGVDDGTVLIVARNDRALRIEVGRGLEGAVPDAIAKRLIAEVIAPRFREGDFFLFLNERWYFAGGKVV